MRSSDKPEYSPESPASERHFTPEQLGELWSLSADTIRRVFEKEPGVLVIERSNGITRRRYRTLRIPDSVADRVHRRMTNPETPLRMPRRSA
jgi:hypothetical protein